jgi:hypothetical protein
VLASLGIASDRSNVLLLIGVRVRMAHGKEHAVAVVLELVDKAQRALLPLVLVLA